MPVPDEILLPQGMFEEFEQDMAETGHGPTVWAIPVNPGQVTCITLVPALLRRVHLLPPELTQLPHLGKL